MVYMIEKKGVLEICAVLGTETGELIILLNLITTKICLYFRSKV